MVAYMLTPPVAVQISAAFIYCLFAAGIVFGYAALKPVLVKEGVYGEYCQPLGFENKKRICYEQELRYNPIYSLARKVIADKSHSTG